MARGLYTLLLWLLLPWVLLHLRLRGKRQPEYRLHWGERFGFYGKRSAGPLIWLHAVSVGETRAAQPLVAALRQRFPDHRILLTHMTPTGRQTGAELFGSDVEQAYLAYDYPAAIARFLAHWQPRFGIVMETELWPNLAAACKTQGIPLFLANARLSERSMRRYRRFAALVRETLQNLAGLAAQSPADAQRFGALGAEHVETFGNLKFDLAVPADKVALGQTFRSSIGPRPVFLCASTREGEEALLLDAWVNAPRGNALLIVVPRHPQRFAAVAALIASRGLRMQKRSDSGVIDATTDVWLGDSLGEMFAYYAASDLAFIGGSLADFGSQNLIEACAVGCPVLLGQSTYNFAQATEDALAAGAALQRGTAAELVATALTLLADKDDRKTMANAGLDFAERHRGATARTVEWLERCLSRAGR
ncbi:MAG: lipid IV(A) 3-deoxy-D-manno-octulosonic acid transferase [Rhodocyclaceae bacterium]|nr:lipid IV(A) 3-deoxy-D-manno-octulosonic acid transferase [Rhodocyclaceae bacterium]